MMEDSQNPVLCDAIDRVVETCEKAGFKSAMSELEGD
jgi:hypothetical protein